MNNNRYTKILFWNIRGINSQEKWDAIRDKINESACQDLCLQESKREHFDHFYLRNSALETWIILFSLPPLELQGAYSLFGITAFLMEALYRLTLMLTL